METEMPLERRHQKIHTGHGTFLPPAERHFVTPDLIEASGGLVGKADQIIERIRTLEAAGLGQIVLLPPIAAALQNFKDFSEQVMARY